MAARRIGDIVQPGDAGIAMRYASSVVIVPGYGLAVAQGQGKLFEFVKLLQAAGVSVKFAMHPVAGRMPGQMDVLLAEAGVPYDMIVQLGDVNDELVSSMADSIAIGEQAVALTGLGAVLSFLLGAATCAILVNHARRRRRQSEYALPLLLEAALLLGFGLLGARLSRMPGLFVPATVMLLCFIMGLQNAVVTKLSKAVIRTTHVTGIVTGIVTDIGIELGKLVYWNAAADLPAVTADMSRLRVLASLLACFFVGGVAGALGFEHLGYVSTVPLACLLIALASVPAYDDPNALLRRSTSR